MNFILENDILKTTQSEFCINLKFKYGYWVQVIINLCWYLSFNWYLKNVDDIFSYNFFFPIFSTYIPTLPYKSFHSKTIFECCFVENGLLYTTENIRNNNVLLTSVDNFLVSV